MKHRLLAFLTTPSIYYQPSTPVGQAIAFRGLPGCEAAADFTGASKP